MAKQNTGNLLVWGAIGAAVAWFVNKQLTAASATSTIPASDVVVPSDMVSQLIPGQPLLRGSILQGVGLYDNTSPAPPVMPRPDAPVNVHWFPDVKQGTRPAIATQRQFWHGPARVRRF